MLALIAVRPARDDFGNECSLLSCNCCEAGKGFPIAGDDRGVADDEYSPVTWNSQAGGHLSPATIVRVDG